MNAFSADVSLMIIFAVAGALIFLYFQRRDFFNVRPILKASMGIFLALGCLLAAPKILMFMAIGFAFSALGDYFLDLPDDKYFMPGLISFFAAHVAYLVFLFPFATWDPITCLVIAVFTFGYFLWLRPSLDKPLVIPVALYSVVIALMGMAAVSTTLPSILIPLGSVLFIASDVVLAIEKFKLKFRFDKMINWILYAGGQILLAIGVLTTVI